MKKKFPSAPKNAVRDTKKTNKEFDPNKPDVEIFVSPVQYDLLSTGKKYRHTLPVNPQPNINGVAKEWKGKYFADNVPEMFKIILGELKFKKGNLVKITDRKNPRRTYLVEIVKVIIDKLNLIEEKDAKAEGVEKLGVKVWRNYNLSEKDAESKVPMRDAQTDTAVKSFSTLWNSTYGPSAWKTDPYVICFTFDVLMYGTSEN